MEQVRGGCQCHHAPLLEHGNAAAQGFGLFKVMRGEQHGAALPVELGDELPKCLPQFHIHTGRRLVKHDHRRLVHQGLSHQHAPLHAARQLAHVGLRLVGQTQADQQLVDPVVIAFDAEVTGLNAQGLAHGKKWVEHQFLGHYPQQATGLGVVADHVVAVHQNPPAAGAGQAGQNADQAGFARAVGAEQTKKFALLNVETDMVQRLHGRSRRTPRRLISFGNRLE